MYDLIVVGDSFSVEPYQHDAVGWIRQLSAISPRRRIEAWANGGRSWSSMLTAFLALLAASPRCAMGALGANDVQGGSTGAQIITVATTARNAALALGLRFACWTIPPSSIFDAAMNVERAIFNAWARALGSTECVDADLLLRSPSDPLILNPRYRIASEPLDVIHPNTLGCAELALAARSQLVLG